MSDALLIPYALAGLGFVLSIVLVLLRSNLGVCWRPEGERDTPGLNVVLLVMFFVAWLALAWLRMTA